MFYYMLYCYIVIGFVVFIMISLIPVPMKRRKYQMNAMFSFIAIPCAFFLLTYLNKIIEFIEKILI